jgi:light-regulated signal transduction histidine kinase (bacteriophytochrome)
LGLRSRAKKLNETLAQKNEELEQFAHIIAHDLKTLLKHTQLMKRRTIKSNNKDFITDTVATTP